MVATIMNSYDLTDGQEPMSHAEIDCLKMLTGELPEKPTIVNIGAADGVSTCAFLEASPDAFIYSIDVEQCPQEFDNVRGCGLDDSRVVRLLGRSEEIGVEFPYRCDLLFVDGGHFNAGNDIDVWRDKVKRGGIIAFHDYQEVCPPENPGSVFTDVNSRLDPDSAMALVDRVIAFRVG
jgi:predicted O-methyltransferase YrrM